MSIEDNLNFMLVLKSLVIHYNLLKKIKNKTTIGLINIRNYAMLKFANKLNWKKLDKSNELYDLTKKKFKVGNNYQIFIR